MARVRYVDTLRLLASREVDFVVVGMAAGVLHGAPVTTLDVDIVHRRTPENVSKIVTCLREIHAVYRHDPRRIAPSESHLIGPGHQLLSTDYGDLDCLGSVDGDKVYEDLLPHSVSVQLGDETSIRVLDLPTLIEVKRRAGRPKDLAVLPVLMATLAERNRNAPASRDRS